MRRALALAVALIPLAASAEGKPQARLVHPTGYSTSHPGSHSRTPRADQYPAVPLFGAHVQEALTWRPLDARGRASRAANRELEHLLRCRQTGQRHAVNPRLADALYRIGRHFPGHRVEIFSGYRPRAFCNRTQSRHMSGSAIDFHVEGIDNRVLVAFLRKTFHPAGIGFYPHGVHVHLDLQREDDAYWVEAEVPLEPRAEAAAPSEAEAAVAQDPAQEAEPDAPDEVLDEEGPVAVRPAQPPPTVAPTPLPMPLPTPLITVEDPALDASHDENAVTVL